MKRIPRAIVMFLLFPLAAAGAERSRAVRFPPVQGHVAVGQEYRIAATPDSPWLESVAVAVGPSSGIVLWTEGGPKTGEATIRLARLAGDGHPLDGAGTLLLENGHYQRHVAIDAFKDQFVAAWCDVAGDTKQIVALRLDASGRALDSVPIVVADSVGNSEPEVGVTCGNAGCLVTWAGDGSYGKLPVGAVSARLLFGAAKAAGAPLLLAPKGIGNGTGTDHLNFGTVYAEQLAYGQSGALVAKFVAADGTAAEMQLLPSSQTQIGTTWMAWNGTQWFVLMLDLTTAGELAQEFRFLRLDAAGHTVGNPTATLLESGSVPLLCPWSPDLFLYDPQNRRVVWDGTNFLVFTQHAIVPVGADGRVSVRVGIDDYFPRGYATSVSSSGNGRTVVAYSRDSAVAIRVIEEMP